MTKIIEILLFNLIINLRVQEVLEGCERVLRK